MCLCLSGIHRVSASRLSVNLFACVFCLCFLSPSSRSHCVCFPVSHLPFSPHMHLLRLSVFPYLCLCRSVCVSILHVSCPFLAPCRRECVLLCLPCRLSALICASVCISLPFRLKYSSVSSPLVSVFLSVGLCLFMHLFVFLFHSVFPTRPFPLSSLGFFFPFDYLFALLFRISLPYCL